MTQPAHDVNTVFQSGADVLAFAKQRTGAGEDLTGRQLGVMIDVLAAAFVTMVANDPARTLATFEFQKRIGEFAFLLDNMKQIRRRP